MSNFVRKTLFNMQKRTFWIKFYNKDVNLNIKFVLI